MESLDSLERVKEEYEDLVVKYTQHQTEQILYTAQKLSKEILEKSISPEEVISIHKNALIKAFPNLNKEVISSFDILLEMMMTYGLAYREHQSLRDKQMEMKIELDIGANLQKTMLGTKIPVIEFLDIGAISVPAKVMNGDYYHFVIDSNQRVNVAIADVIGKGIPAALCMSMIKYAMDNLSDSVNNSPDTILENLNRMVEKNITPGMFITMFYGNYDPISSVFEYASAGHEPGFYYCNHENRFTDLDAKGVILGIDSTVHYQKYMKQIKVGDMIVLLSDGVTETRTDEGFLERETITLLIQKYIHLSAQEIVHNIYKDLEKLQHYQLRDDFTMIILRRIV